MVHIKCHLTIRGTWPFWAAVARRRHFAIDNRRERFMGLNAMSMVPRPQRASRAIGRLGSTPPVFNRLVLDNEAAALETELAVLDDHFRSASGTKEEARRGVPLGKRRRQNTGESTGSSSATEHKKTRVHKVLTLDEIRPFFCVSLLEASTSLGVCTTNLKKQSRRLVRT
jgi:hypothetical protein